MVGCVLAGLSNQFIGVVAIIVFVVAWIHGNGVLSECDASVGPRLSEIDAEVTRIPSANLYLEQGLLRARILIQNKEAEKSIERALDQSGGDGSLFNAAGEVLLASRSLEGAKRCFERAAAATSDVEVLRKVRHNQSLLNVSSPR
jgi:hypothetical protein